VFSVIKTQKPSARGELEITDVNNYFVKKGVLEYSIIQGFWGDAGTPYSLYQTSKYIAEKTLKTNENK
jgi:glucose-1-phosphate thymidylyltransferase